MKHIVVDARYVNRPGMGIHVYLNGLLSVLSKEDHKITLLVDTEVNNIVPAKQANIVILRSGSRIVWEQILLPRFLKKCQPDLFIAPANFGMPLFYRKRDTKFVLVIHDFIPLHFPLTYLLKRPFYLGEFVLSVPISIYRSDLILANSQFTANEVMRFFHKRAFNAYIPLSYKITPKKPVYHEDYFLYDSGSDPRKKVGTLIEGFHAFDDAHPGYKLFIMGKGYDKYQSMVKSRHYKNIVFLGYVSDAKKDTYTQNAQAMVTVSKMEGFGLPVIEAFCASVPVICSQNSALQEVAGNAALYIESLTAAGVATALAKFAELSVNAKQSLVDNGHKRVKFFNGFDSELLISQKINDLLSA